MVGLIIFQKGRFVQFSVQRWEKRKKKPSHARFFPLCRSPIPPPPLPCRCAAARFFPPSPRLLLCRPLRRPLSRFSYTFSFPLLAESSTRSASMFSIGGGIFSGGGGWSWRRHLQRRRRTPVADLGLTQKRSCPPMPPRRGSSRARTRSSPTPASSRQPYQHCSRRCWSRSPRLTLAPPDCRSSCPTWYLAILALGMPN
ncbi:hypothetical protein ACQJBY_059805 [Aegilops geniculata]